MLSAVSHAFTWFYLFLAFMLLTPQLSKATEEYARQSGQSCAVCHLDPAGGGELTAAGTSFSVKQHSKIDRPATDMIAKIFRLAIGYIHFLTAIFWFGTILYVHLILKPAYAASGLPRGELRVGIISMIVMGISGVILTIYRIPSFNALLETRFGILLVIKISLYLLMVFSAVFVITIIGPRLKAKRKEPAQTDATGSMTLENLASYNGKDGRPAYFAFEGKIYDPAQSPLWKNGVHMGRHNAGSDLTEALNLAPHGREKVTAMKIIGDLVDSGPRKVPLHERVFFFMAHMNLAIVFIIILILCLWRWG